MVRVFGSQKPVKLLKFHMTRPTTKTLHSIDSTRDATEEKFQYFRNSNTLTIKLLVERKFVATSQDWFSRKCVLKPSVAA